MARRVRGARYSSGARARLVRGVRRDGARVRRSLGVREDSRGTSARRAAGDVREALHGEALVVGGAGAFARGDARDGARVARGVREPEGQRHREARVGAAAWRLAEHTGRRGRAAARGALRGLGEHARAGAASGGRAPAPDRREPGPRRVPRGDGAGVLVWSRREHGRAGAGDGDRVPVVPAGHGRRGK